jgi:hypothetical protein
MAADYPGDTARCFRDGPGRRLPLQGIQAAGGWTTGATDIPGLQYAGGRNGLGNDELAPS